MTTSPLTGVAAGVPFTALPPAGAPTAPALVVTWHLMDPPCTDAAMAAALPLAGLPAWRVHLGLPLTGRRLPEGGFEELMRRGMADAVLNLFGPILDAAAAEAPAAVEAVRAELGIPDGRVALVGGSIGAGVALEVLARGEVPAAAVALVSPMVRVAGAVAANEAAMGVSYRWSDASRAVAERYDFVRRADEVAGAPLLVVVGGADAAPFRADAQSLRAALDAAGAAVTLHEVSGMPHHLAEPPGVEPAPQNAHAAAVDELLTGWLGARLPV